MTRSRRVTWAAAFLALGLILPMAFHFTVPGSGKIFLPMHIPVLLAGMLCGPYMGAVVGLLAPGLSGLLTGMPPIVPPVAQTMTVELALYGGLAGLSYRRWKWPLPAALVFAMLGGRVAYGLATAYVLPLFGLQAVPLWVVLTTSVATGWPGLLVQLAAIPAVVLAVERLANRVRG